MNLPKFFFLFILGTFFFVSPAYSAEKSSNQSSGESQVPVTQSQPLKFPEWGTTPIPDDAFDEMDQMQTTMTKIWRESMKRMKNYQNAGKFFEPDADFVEREKDYVLRADLPGMKKDQIKVDITDNTITLSGERMTERQETTEKGYELMERSSGSFVRSLTLPGDARTDGVTAKYEDGVLEVVLPKKEPTAASGSTVVPVQ